MKTDHRMRRCAALLCSMLASTWALADSPRELLDAATTHYSAVGRTQALDDFTAAPDFVRGALYVFCVDRSGRLSASGGFPRMVGMDLDRFEIGGQRGLAALMNRDTGDDEAREVEYRWINPHSGAMEHKHTVFRDLGEDVCGVGVYTPITPPGPTRRR